MDALMLDSAYAAAGALGFMDGLVIIRNGCLVREGYYNGYTSKTPHQIYSDTKSFMSALIGIAFQEGYFDSLETRIMTFFPDYAYGGMDPRFNDITLRHLLMMRMGIDAEENNLMAVVVTDDWVRETFRLPLLFNPGERFLYNSLETHLLSVMLGRRTGMNALMYARRRLTGPMGIEIASWGQDPSGNSNGGYDIYMTPRDMAVFGYLYLNGGALRGRQIVPKAWVDSSLTRRWPRDSRQWGALKNYNYGYLWWLGQMNGYELFMALGMGGQYIIVFPSLNLIVVTTANRNILWDNQQELPILDVVSRYVLPAVRAN